MYLILQGEVEGRVFDPHVFVDLHLRGVLICLEVFDDIGEPYRQAIIPGARKSQEISRDREAIRSPRSDTVIHSENGKEKRGQREMGRIRNTGTSVVSFRSSSVFGSCFFSYRDTDGAVLIRGGVIDLETAQHLPGLKITGEKKKTTTQTCKRAPMSERRDRTRLFFDTNRTGGGAHPNESVNHTMVRRIMFSLMG